MGTGFANVDQDAPGGLTRIALAAAAAAGSARAHGERGNRPPSAGMTRIAAAAAEAAAESSAERASSPVSSPAFSRRRRFSTNSVGVGRGREGISEAGIQTAGIVKARPPSMLSFESGPDAPDEDAQKTLNALLRFSPLALAIFDVLDDDGKPDEALIMFVNDLFLSWTGYDMEAVYGSTCQDLLSGPKTDKWVFAQMAVAIQTSMDFHGEVLMQRKGGAPLWADFMCMPVYAASGKVSHYVGIFDFSLVAPEGEVQRAEIQVSKAMAAREAEAKAAERAALSSGLAGVRPPARQRISVSSQSAASTLAVIQEWMPFRERKFSVSDMNKMGSRTGGTVMDLASDPGGGDGSPGGSSGYARYQPLGPGGSSPGATSRMGRATTAAGGRRQRRDAGECDITPDTSVWSHKLLSILRPETIRDLSCQDKELPGRHNIHELRSARRQSVF